jgi:hypothetical protein
VAVTTLAKRRVVWAFTIGVGLILLASGILVLAEATAIPDGAKRCAPGIWQSQWPRYLGCAMTTHDGLAGGLIAAGGALFAALLAIDAIQQRTSRGSDRQKLEQAEAKISAVVHITPLVHAAAECLPAMPNGRCRMHGGPSPGAPKGNKNAYKHGRYTAEAIARRREISALIRAARDLMRR